MPHFVVDCSESILSTHAEETINEQLHQAANSTGLFSEGNIQVRVKAYSANLVGGKKQEFIQVFASILEGRTKEQKQALSQTVVAKLVEMFPEVQEIGMNIRDMEKGTGCSKSKLMAG